MTSAVGAVPAAAFWWYPAVSVSWRTKLGSVGNSAVGASVAAVNSSLVLRRDENDDTDIPRIIRSMVGTPERSPRLPTNSTLNFGHGSSADYPSILTYKKDAVGASVMKKGKSFLCCKSLVFASRYPLAPYPDHGSTSKPQQTGNSTSTYPDTSQCLRRVFSICPSRWRHPCLAHSCWRMALSVLLIRVHQCVRACPQS